MRAIDFCLADIFVVHSFRFVSVLQEVHIACYFVLQAFKFEDCLLGSSKLWIVIAWIAGITFGVGDLLLSPWHLDTKSGSCKQSGHSYVSAVVLLLGFVANCVAYGVVIFRSSQRAPKSVLRRALRRAAMYPLNFLLTYSLLLAAYLDSDLWDVDGFIAFAWVLESCNGLLNALIYACQGRYSVALSAEEATGRYVGALAGASSTKAVNRSLVAELGSAEVIEVLWESGLQNPVFDVRIIDGEKVASEAAMGAAGAGPDAKGNAYDVQHGVPHWLYAE